MSSHGAAFVIEKIVFRMRQTHEGITCGGNAVEHNGRE